MNSKTILGASLAAVFVVSMTLPAFASGHLTIDSAEVSPKKSGTIEIITSATIPQGGSAGAFGYALFGSTGILAVTTHGGVGPDSGAQSGAADPVFHTHLVTLTTETDCVSGIQVASASFEEVGNLEVKTNKVEVKEIDDAIGALTGPVVSFSLTIEDGAICVNVADAVAPETD